MNLRDVQRNSDEIMASCRQIVLDYDRSIVGGANSIEDADTLRLAEAVRDALSRCCQDINLAKVRSTHGDTIASLFDNGHTLHRSEWGYDERS